ncbi:MAG: EamA family transporter [Chroococcidiopsidaceae cyanobacterium CP_BM_ER_R8_30]|nr:EamA family transporter [Chroococcidiopsidaceae cyanobacterium CP_BM_ER_R8_30]
MLANNLWFIYALGAAILWGLQYATIEQLSKTIPTPLLTLAYTIALALTYLFVFVCFRFELSLAQLRNYWTIRNLLLFGLVVLVGCASTILIFAAIAKGTATKASIIEITYPIFVALFAILLYQEDTLNWQTLIGGLIILFGVIIVLRG